MLLGVGPPGRASASGGTLPGGLPAPGAAGRGPPGAGRGPGLVKGLLPGPRGTLRGAPGRPGTPGRPGVTPGALGAAEPAPGVAGPGVLGLVSGAGRAGAAGAAWAAGANGSGATRGAGDGAGATGDPGPPGAEGPAGVSAAGRDGRDATGGAEGADAAAAFAFAAGAGPGFAAAGVGSPNASLSLRTTGGSTVDDADFTNSPRSLSFARTVLLSTPSSLASSWTRAFPATVLLFLGPRLPARPPITAWENSSLSAHRASIRETHFRTAAETVVLVSAVELSIVSSCQATRDLRDGLVTDPPQEPRATATPGETPDGGSLTPDIAGRGARELPYPAAGDEDREREHFRWQRRAASR